MKSHGAGDYGPQIKSWAAAREKFELLKQENEFVIHSESDDEPGTHTYHQHSDLSLLKIFAEDVLMAPIPD